MLLDLSKAEGTQSYETGREQQGLARTCFCRVDYKWMRGAEEKSKGKSSSRSAIL